MIFTILIVFSILTIILMSSTKTFNYKHVVRYFQLPKVKPEVQSKIDRIQNRHPSNFSKMKKRRK